MINLSINIEQALQALANEIAAESQDYIRLNAFDTGDLESSISVSPVKRNGSEYSVTIFSDTALLTLQGSQTNYAKYVHDGTGEYGPYSQPIKPKNGKCIRFKGKYGWRTVKEIKGMRARPFFTEALKKVDFTKFLDGLKIEITR